ncbi:glycosyltransferase family 4 protein [Peristeroidobacter agariperforans]|uniref:glycosyltransferase family 4 protein n=1 Tax=Peristeroidobacter agariperforans TaxID=268404 RepID=UPI001300A3C9|nr:glycosyltransferase family 1 protein [Peristeroidobacter agariperforans]
MTSKRTIAVMARLVDQKDGIGIYGQYLLRELLLADPETRYVILLETPTCEQMFRDYSNAHVVVMPARSKLYWDQVRVPRAAREFNADLIFNPKFSLPFFTRRPCVFVQQGSDWYVNPQNYPWWDNLYIRLMLPLYSWKASRTLAISQQTLDDLANYTSIDVRDSVVSYAGIGANFTVERDPRALEQFRAEHRLPERFILTVARVLHGGQKQVREYPGGNNERLIRAYRRYRRDGGDLPLVVVGRHVEEYLRARSFSDADLEDVQFLGFVPNQRLHLAYQLADCFVLATLCESFGIPIVEAFACGCPAIVPNTCAAPEIAGGAAFLINPRDEVDIARAFTEVTESEQLRGRLRELGIQRARTLTWKETARRTLAVFNELVPLQTSMQLAPAPSAHEIKIDR